MVGLSLSMGFSHRLEHRQLLSLEQRQEVVAALLMRRENLVVALRGENFRPTAQCPKCFHTLSSIEILKGFSLDPHDYDTTCPKCRHRFSPRFVTSNEFSSASISFYCAIQTLDQLRNREVMSPEVWKEKDRAVYHSAIYHFGSLAAAYREIEIPYEHKETLDWRDKIRSFLGTMPDTEIASVIGVAVREIRKLRQSLGIERYLRTEDEVLYSY